MHQINLEQILQQEKAAQAKLRDAELAYKEESQQLRNQLGNLFAAERERAGISRQQLATMLKTNRQCIFAAEYPEKVPNPFSVEHMIALIQDARKVADLFQAHDFKASRQGRINFKKALKA